MSNLTPGTRVELLADREKVYRFARAGAQGTVVDQREDEYGYPLVYVEWDQDVDEANCWTFASHFRVLDQPTAEDMVRRAEESRPRCPTCDQVHEPQNDKYATHLDILSAATEAAAQADGYMVITMEKNVGPGGSFIKPRVYLSTMTQMASLIVEAQVVEMAQRYHRERIDADVVSLVEEEEDGRQ